MKNELNFQKNSLFILKDKISEADDVVTLKFSSSEAPPFTPGQFVNIYFLDDRCGGQGKPYSISSVPSDDFLNVTVKKVGGFSGALHDLKIGERVKISSPQGYFYPEDEMKDVVFLAGGIGITPFYSIIKNNFDNKTNKNIFLFYSNKTRNSAAFLNNLNNLAKNWLKLKVVNIFTRESAAWRTKTLAAENNEYGRINIKMLKKYLKDLDRKHYFICGSVSFVNDLWRELKKNKVEEDYIKVESFF